MWYIPQEPGGGEQARPRPRLTPGRLHILPNALNAPLAHMHQVLLCMARPTSDIEVEIQSDWGYSLGGEWKGASGSFEATPQPLMGQKWKE